MVLSGARILMLQQAEAGGKENMKAGGISYRTFAWHRACSEICYTAALGQDDGCDCKHSSITCFVSFQSFVPVQSYDFLS